MVVVSTVVERCQREENTSGCGSVSTDVSRQFANKPHFNHADIERRIAPTLGKMAKKTTAGLCLVWDGWTDRIAGRMRGEGRKEESKGDE